MRRINVKRKRSPLFWNTVRKRALAKDFTFNVGTRSIRVSAEERSCLEGVYTVRWSEGWAAEDESENKLWQIVDSLWSLFWLGPVNQQRA